MNKIPLIAAAVLASTLAAAPATASEARIWGTVQIGLPIPIPVPVLPRIEVVPQPVYVTPGWRDRDRDGVPDWRDSYDNRRHWRHPHAARIDRDRDGIPDWRDPYDNRRDWAPAWRDGPHDGRWGDGRWGHGRR